MVDKWDVYATRFLPKQLCDLLGKQCSLEVFPKNRTIRREELLAKVEGRDGIIAIYGDKIDEQVLEALGAKCKIIANCAVGFDNIDVDAATKRNIYVTNAPGTNHHTVADMAWGLIFAVSRKIVDADRLMRQGLYKGYDSFYQGLDITGKTLGIIGAGRIGSVFGKKAKGFDMRLLYCDIERNETFEQETAAEYVDKQVLLTESDFISIHVPLLPATKHLIGEKEFCMMKKTSILINTARGPIVDEKALVNALKENQIWGAGLDVFEWEPDVSPELKEMRNVVLTSHLASCSTEAFYRTKKVAVENILAAIKDQRPPNCVNL